MHRKPTNLHPMLARYQLHLRAFARHFNKFLLVVAILVQLSYIPRCDGVGEGQGDGVVNTCEPDGDVRDESHLCPELGGDLAFVDVVGKGVGDQIVCEVIDVVFGGGFGAGARVTGDAEDGWAGRFWGEVGDQGCDAELSCGGVAARIRNAGCGGDLVALDEFGETVGPGRVKAVVGGEVDDYRFMVTALVD